MHIAVLRGALRPSWSLCRMYGLLHFALLHFWESCAHRGDLDCLVCREIARCSSLLCRMVWQMQFAVSALCAWRRESCYLYALVVGGWSGFRLDLRVSRRFGYRLGSGHRRWRLDFCSCNWNLRAVPWCLCWDCKWRSWRYQFLSCCASSHWWASGRKASRMRRSYLHVGRLRLS